MTEENAEVVPPDQKRLAQVRFGRFSALSILAVLVVAGVALFVEVDHYQPLGEAYGEGYGVRMLSQSGALIKPITNEASSPYAFGWVWPEPSGVFRVEILTELINGGRWPVTIDAIQRPSWATGPILVYLDGPGTGGSMNGGAAFHPFSLGSDSSEQITLHLSIACVPRAAHQVTTYSQVPLTYTFVGLSHTVQVPISPLTLAGPQSCHS
jgi:hypothetical protein